eukprot:c5040_g1_i1 orf=299-838(-)
MATSSDQPNESSAVVDSSRPQVQVEIYIDGEGPRHAFRAPLQGWDQNRLDLELMMQTYNLKALYAFSLSSGRGQRLLFNPRNGFSLVAYSGKVDSLVRLDADPKDSLLWLSIKFLLVAAFLGSISLLFVAESSPRWVALLRQTGARHVGWLVCFVVMIYTQLVWRPSRRKKKFGVTSRN